MEYKCPNCSGVLVKKSPTGFIDDENSYFCESGCEYFTYEYLLGWYHALEISPRIATLKARLAEAEASCRVAQEFHTEIMVMFSTPNPKPNFTEANRIWQKFNMPKGGDTV